MFLYYVENSNNSYDIIFNKKGNQKIILNDLTLEDAIEWIKNINILFEDNLNDIELILDDKNKINKDTFIKLLVDKYNQTKRNKICIPVKAPFHDDNVDKFYTYRTPYVYEIPQKKTNEDPNHGYTRPFCW